jgi:type IV pilus assembly protein PilW
MRTVHSRLALRRHACGVTLIELMVAITIGAFLMTGAINVFTQSRATFRVNQSVSRLQENARFALATIEPDIRMASYYGLETRGSRIAGRAKTTAPNGVGPATCGNNWAIDLDSPVAGTNNAYRWGCAATGGYRAGTDTIVIRRVSPDSLAPAALVTALYVQSSRAEQGRIFLGPAVPADAPVGSETFQLVATGYYISRQSQSLGTNGATIPSLHRKRLQTNAAAITDEEILAGVEDLQIEFGVDTDIVGTPNRGAVDRYVHANDAILDPASPNYDPNVVILAVRIWLRLRAEDIENGFSDTTTYVYADVNYRPAAAERPFRRLLVSKTIYLRNARRMS